MARVTARITGNDGVRYLRVSSQGQVNTDYNPEGISIPAQREAAILRERELKSLNVKEFIDPGRSAKTIEHREAFQEMIAYLRENPNVRYVVVYALSRFARNRYDDAIMMVTLEKLGVTLISATERNLDDTPAGKAMHGMIAVWNQYRVEADGEDIKYKMGQKAKSGGTLGQAKIGYKNVRENFDGREVRTVAVDPLRSKYVVMAFELYAIGKYNFHTLRDALTEAGLLTKGNRRFGPRPVSIHKIGQLLQDRYYLGFVEYDGQEYKGRHEPLISQELFDRVQRVLFKERGAGARHRTHNHYLKGVIWCDRCGKRLIIVPGRSKNGTQYFYYTCRGRVDRSCDLPYMSVVNVERAVETHYITVRLDDRYRTEMTKRLASAKAEYTSINQKLTAEMSRQLKALSEKEDRLLDLVGDPDWPREKLSARMRDIRDQRTQIEQRLDNLGSPVSEGHEVLTTVLRLLQDPRDTYSKATQRQRKVLNRAIFNKLYVEVDEDGQPVITNDELNEPFSTTVYLRREWSLSESVEAVQAKRGVRNRNTASSDLGLLSAHDLVGQCSNKSPMVDRRWHNPNRIFAAQGPYRRWIMPDSGRLAISGYRRRSGRRLRSPASGARRHRIDRRSSQGC